MSRMSICNRDCFNCIFPDCINDEVTADDVAELEIVERNFIRPPRPKALRRKKRQADPESYHRWAQENNAHKHAYDRAYYRLHRQKRLEYARKYYLRKKES